jgi:hypothetical protein
MAKEQPSYNLGAVRRFITDHDPDGLAIFNKDIPEIVPAKSLQTGDPFHLGYVTSEIPTDTTTGLATYQSHLSGDPVFTVPGGTALSVIDLRPGSLGPMHRTLSLDYAAVLDGAV